MEEFIEQKILILGSVFDGSSPRKGLLNRNLQSDLSTRIHAKNDSAFSKFYFFVFFSFFCVDVSNSKTKLL